MDDITTVSTISIELARFLGLFMCIIGFGIAFNSNHILKIALNMPQNHGMQLTAAVFPALVGSWIVAVHGSCTGNWDCFITAIGWLMVLGAFYRAWLPAHWASMVYRFATQLTFRIAGSIIGILGLFLFYKGWIDPS
jgi:hypothetical protein